MSSPTLRVSSPRKVSVLALNQCKKRHFLEKRRILCEGNFASFKGFLGCVILNLLMDCTVFELDEAVVGVDVNVKVLQHDELPALVALLSPTPAVILVLH